MTIVIGGGPAGMISAYEARINGEDVILIEKNEKLGKKLYITGKGRCNLTNNSSIDNFMHNIRNNGKFLLSSLNNFKPDDTMAFFEAYGLSLKTERGNRVFPESDKSSDVIKTMVYAVTSAGVDVHLNEEVKSITKEDRFTVVTDKNTYDCDNVVIATGGLSYPLTGSTGDGYKFARSLGHKVTKLYPSLTGLNIKGSEYAPLQGLTLKNVSLSCTLKGKKIYDEQGEMLFTHFGISGPLVLTLSTYLSGENLSDCIVSIDFKPALDEETLDNRILREFDTYHNKEIKNVVGLLVPKTLISIVLNRANINENVKCNSVTSEERHRLIGVLKNMSFKVDSLRGFDEAIITKGGVDVTEINPKTMESKIVKGLYFAGEVLDVDACTGGYNIQIALSTGYASGTHLGD